MEKIGILLFVGGLILVFFGCEKKNSPDEEFQVYVAELQNNLGIVLLEKNENEIFLPIELLEKDTARNLSDFFFNKLMESLSFSNSHLNEKNELTKKIIRQYDAHKLIWIGSEDYADSLRIFSIVDVLSTEVRDENYSLEEQFSQIISRLEEMPTYFSKAKEVIKKPTKEKLENAIYQYSKDFFYLKNELSLLIRKPDILKEDQIDFSQKNEKAQLAIKDFIAFLNSQLFELNNQKSL